MGNRRYWFRRTGRLHWVPVGTHGRIATIVFVAVLIAGSEMLAHAAVPSWWLPAFICLWLAALGILIARTAEP